MHKKERKKEIIFNDDDISVAGRLTQHNLTDFFLSFLWFFYRSEIFLCNKYNLLNMLFNTLLIIIF